MSLVGPHNIDQLIDDLLSNKVYIAFFVHAEQCYWVADSDEHFNLDHSIHIEAVCDQPHTKEYLPKGQSIAEYKRKYYKNYRGGITKLTIDTFPEYLNLDTTMLLNSEALMKMISLKRWGNYQHLYDSMERYILFGQPETSDENYFTIRDLRRLLPTYYINFNRKKYMHMRSERFHEAQVHEDWSGAEGDFEHMIPIKYRYWEISKACDYWAVNNFVNA